MDRTETIVVIGSGPSVGNNGAEIDGYPVVRMHNHEWQTELRYGARYDYGLITTTHEARCASRRPDVAWFFYNVPHERPIKEIDGIPVVTLDHFEWFHRATAMGAKPGSPTKALKFTRGFAAVAAAIGLRSRRVVVVGMDLLRDGVTAGRYYDADAHPYYVSQYTLLARADPAFVANEIPEGMVREGPHDYAAEAALIYALAAEAGTEIAWGF